MDFLAPLPIRSALLDGSDVSSDGSGMTIQTDSSGAASLGNLQRQWVLWLTDIVTQLNTLINDATAQGAGSIVAFSTTLTANSPAPDIPDVKPGALVIILVIEDGTGGWVQTWPAAFVGMAGFVQTTTANTYTAALFLCVNATTFLLLSPPVTGAQ